MQVYGTQRLKKPIAEEAGHRGRVKQSKITGLFKTLTAIDHQMNIQRRTHKLLKQMPGDLEHAVKSRGNQDEIANTLQDVMKRTNMGKYSQFKSSSFKEKQPFRLEFKDKPKERVEEVTNKKTSCSNCGSTDHYANNYSKAN
ncbi:hypothetical protein O181_059202 [Austropuccinia psidii MF-1]|uniref:Uncharacterized protein n=1 Tax=Austropuccinia psidii MF-1 TaxID=1389203 RepID=A0A9Q3EG72_9BASI|nr:hypothetical protein [Austropuccinia psidii MF-1]